MRGVTCPTPGRCAPAVIDDRHVDASVDEELHGLVILVPHQFMQDAGGFVRAPVRVDIGSMPEKKVGDLEMVVHDGPGERGVENLLQTGLAPVQVPADPVIVGWKMIREVAQGRLAGRVKPAPRLSEVPIPSCVGRSSGIGQIRTSIGTRWACAYVNACTKAREGGGAGLWSKAGSRSRNALRKAARSFNAAAVSSIKRTWNFTHASDSIHDSRRNRSTKDVRSPSCIARTTCCSTKACQGLNGSRSWTSGLLSMKYWINAEHPGPPSIRLPSSASKVIDRSNSRAAVVACWRWQAYRNASFTAARSSAFVSRHARTPLTSPSAAKNLSVRGRMPLRWNRPINVFARARIRSSHTDGATTAPASSRSSAHARRVKCCSLTGSALSPKEPVAIPSNPPSFSSALHDNRAGYSVNSCRRPSTSLSWMRRRAWGTAHSIPLPSRCFTSLIKSCQPEKPYSRASTSWRSRWDNGSSACGSWA